MFSVESFIFNDVVIVIYFIDYGLLRGLIYELIIISWIEKRKTNQFLIIKSSTKN